MIIGTVNADNEAMIPLTLLDADGRRRALRAVIDTGFSGYLTLPASLIDDLGLTWQTRVDATLADGSSQSLNVYAAQVVWDELTRTVEVAAADVFPLVGMAMLRGYAVTIHVEEDGPVRIQLLR